MFPELPSGTQVKGTDIMTEERKIEYLPVEVDKKLVGQIDALIRGGQYPSRTEFLRKAVEGLLDKEKECFVDLECLADE
jgi:hypothetical protein